MLREEFKHKLQSKPDKYVRRLMAGDSYSIIRPLAEWSLWVLRLLKQIRVISIAFSYAGHQVEHLFMSQLSAYYYYTRLIW